MAAIKQEEIILAETKEVKPMGRTPKHEALHRSIVELDLALDRLSSLRRRISGEKSPGQAAVPDGAANEVDRPPCLQEVMASAPDQISKLTIGIDEEIGALKEILF
jgi:hypothetical protein